MNKRIEELAEQAAKFSATMALPTGESGDKLFVTEFANLIIQECIDAVMSSDRHRRDYFAEKIKQRFGMSEYED